MLIGDPEDFAIEAMIEPELASWSAEWGRMCVHVAGTVIGDFENSHCGLGPAYGQFKWYAEERVDLWDPAFDGLEPEQVHRVVHEAIWGTDERTREQIRQDAIRYTRFVFLTNWGEQFDGVSGVIVSPRPDVLMVLHRPFGGPAAAALSEDLVVSRCTRSAFERAAAGFVAWFEARSEEVRGRDE